jgi:hypothetical protein
MNANQRYSWGIRGVCSDPNHVSGCIGFMCCVKVPCRPAPWLLAVASAWLSRLQGDAAWGRQHAVGQVCLQPQLTACRAINGRGPAGLADHPVLTRRAFDGPLNKALRERCLQAAPMLCCMACRAVCAVRGVAAPLSSWLCRLQAGAARGRHPLHAASGCDWHCHAS